MSYNLNRSKVGLPPIVVEDNTVNETTSLSFPGRNTTNYGQLVGENFLHLLENFASDTAPINPIAGQLWYDTTDGVTQLKIYDGTNWAQAGGLKKGSTEPDLETSLVGDLWVNTGTQQLYLFSGASWVLVGPQFGAGERTGADPEPITDTADVSHYVVSMFVEGERVAIISSVEFTPKSFIDGFPSIKAGVTLNSNYNLYYGVARTSQTLLVGTSEVDAANFLRSDVTSNSNYAINIRNSEGLSVGEGRQFAMYLDGATGVVSNRTAGSNINVRVSDITGNSKTVLTIDSNERVGINKRNPEQALDVVGNIQSSGSLTVNDTTESITTTTGSGVFAGGVGVAGDLNLGGGFVIGGDFLPDVNLGADIGTNIRRFGSIYAGSFNGELSGDHRGGALIGTDITNSSGVAPVAARLVSSTSFTIGGESSDITSDGFEFDGTGSSKNFVATLNNTFITSKPSTTAIGENDEFIISRPPLNSLLKIKKSSLWQAISRMPIGMISPYAGPNAPQGWLLCDGSEVLRADYPELFEVIRYTYGDPLTLLGQAGATFKLPDFRGRFALGFDNMDSGITVPSKDNPLVSVPTGGGTANRVTDDEADFDPLDPYAARNGTGSNTAILDIENLPDHKHDLRGTKSDGSKGEQYYALRNSVESNTDVDRVDHTLKGPTEEGSGQYLANSGGILVSGGTALNQPVDIMNPYLAVNYIIYTGKDV